MSNEQKNTQGKKITTCQDSQIPTTTVKTEPPVKPKNNK